MSIITDALKKAEKERDKTVVSREYLNKILGPERKVTHKREEQKEEPKIEKPKFRPERVLSKNEGIEFLYPHYAKSKIIIISGILLLSAIILLTIINIFFIPSPEVKIATSEIKKTPIMAEAYTDMKSEIRKTDFVGKMAQVFRSDLVQDGVLSSYKLNGIVYDNEDSWAIINNKMAKVGDTLDDATIISIAPQKVTILFQNKRYDLTVK